MRDSFVNANHHPDQDEMLILAFSEVRQRAAINRIDLWGVLEAAAKVAGPNVSGDALVQKLSKRRKEILMHDAKRGDNVGSSSSKYTWTNTHHARLCTLGYNLLRLFGSHLL
jgi:hypothetical protein